MNDKLEKELLTALILMVDQYLSSADGLNHLDHRFMCAGEHALSVLEDLGYVTGSGRRYVWTGKEKELC